MKVFQNAPIITSKPLPNLGVRHVQVLMMFFLTSVMSGMRFSVSVSILAMTDNTTSINPDIPTYNWENKGVILSSFYWGYMLLQILAAEMTRAYGTKSVLITSMFVNSVVFLIIPITASTIGNYGVLACRVIQGIVQGCFCPSIFTFLGEWSPASERSILGAVSMSGGTLGVIVTMPLTALICTSWWGWPASFYFYGSTGLLWIIACYFFVADSPRKHKSITMQEIQFIEGSTPSNKDNTNTTTPWKDILTSLPFWACASSLIGLRWLDITLLTEMPTYINKVMNMDIQSGGFLSAMPYVISLALAFPAGFTSDYIIRKKYLTRVATRRLYTTLCSSGPGLSMLILSFLPKGDRVFSLIMLALATGFGACSFGGFLPNMIDLSPRYSGTLMAISNAFGTLPAMLAPLFVHFMVHDDSDKSQWQIVFIVSAMGSISSNIFFFIYASGDIQPWNFARSNRQNKKVNEETNVTELKV